MTVEGHQGRLPSMVLQWPNIPKTDLPIFGYLNLWIRKIEVVIPSEAVRDPIGHVTDSGKGSGKMYGRLSSLSSGNIYETQNTELRGRERCESGKRHSGGLDLSVLQNRLHDGVVGFGPLLRRSRDSSPSRTDHHHQSTACSWSLLAHP